MIAAGLGFAADYRAEVAAIALHASVRHRTSGWRDGARATVAVAGLVPGDIVELSVGAAVPQRRSDH